LIAVLHHANHIERELSEFVPSASNEVRALQIAERDRLFKALEERVKIPMTGLQVSEDTDAGAVRHKLERAAAELDRINAALERIPSLGVVTEHGGGTRT
jgi:molecular chaperone DnaK